MEPNNQFNTPDMGMPNNNAPLGATNPVSAPIETKKKVGPIVVVLAIVLILIIGALYLFASGMGDSATPTDEMTQETVQPVTNSSDDIQAIDADLNSAIDGIDAQTF